MTGCILCLNAFTIQMLVFNLDKITLSHFSGKTIESEDIVLELPRCGKCVAYYELILPQPTGGRYTAIFKALLKEYPWLRDKGIFIG